VGLESGGDLGGEAIAVHGQGAAGRHLVLVAAGQDDRAAAAHLGVQQAHGVVLPVVGAERVGADQLGEAVGLVGVGAAHRAHFVQDGRHAGFRQLPGRFGSGQAAADYVNRIHGHGGQIGRPAPRAKPAKVAPRPIL